MAKRGRKPKPTALKKLEGNPGKRPLNELEPLPQVTMLRCPNWLEPEAKKEWRRLAPVLIGAGILTGKFKEPPKPTEGDKRANFYPFFAEPFFGKTQELLVTLREIAEAHDKPIAHVAINWVSQQPGMTCALTGSKNVDQAVMNAAAGDWDLTAEELKKIDDAYDRIFRA